jgi:RNA polymerase sigma-70 factor (ECF subfamily)
MADSPATRASLLVRLRNPRDGGAWAEFVDLYAPLVHRYACKHGLQDADAADLTQDILRTVAGVMPTWKYDPARGSFRGWLFTLARNRLRDHLESCQRREQGSGDTQTQERLEAQPVPEEDWWEQEYQRQLLFQAGEQIRSAFQEKTWQAFWRTTVDGQSPSETAAELEMTVAAVYLAKSRIMARLKAVIRLWQEE